MTISHLLSSTATYKIWKQMRYRVKHDPNYTERGITICERWNDYECFLEDMGERPPGLSIERVDNDGNYCPSNCIWADRQTQNTNRRPARYPFLKRVGTNEPLRYITIKPWGSVELHIRLRRKTTFTKSFKSLDEALALRSDLEMERQMYHLLGGL